MQTQSSAQPIRLSFYDHHRQTYGHMPIREDRAAAEFFVGDYGDPGEDNGVGSGGEFGIYLVRLRLSSDRAGCYMTPYLRVFSDATGSLKAFLDSGAWDRVSDAAERRAIHTRDDLTELLAKAGLYDRSHYPIGHEPVCHCCGRPTLSGASREQRA